jgi:hypothetical protein
MARSGFNEGLPFSVRGWNFDVLLDCSGRGRSSGSTEFCRKEGGREEGRETTQGSAVPVNMLCRLSRVLTPDALRRLALSIKVAPVEFDRFERLPKLAPLSGATELERWMLATDVQRLPLFMDSFIGLKSSRPIGTSFSFGAGEPYREDVGETIDLAAVGEKSGSL